MDPRFVRLRCDEEPRSAFLVRSIRPGGRADPTADRDAKEQSKWPARYSSSGKARDSGLSDGNILFDTAATCPDSADDYTVKPKRNSAAKDYDSGVIGRVEP